MVGERGPASQAPPGGPTHDFVVRPARPGDARSYLDLFRTVVAEGRFIRTETVRRGLRHHRRRLSKSWDDEQAVIVALHGDRVIGELSVSREEHPVTRHIASIGMMVAPDWRGRGVGSALMTEALRWALEMGVEKLALSVYPDNEPARALYRKFGFEEEGRLTGHSKKRLGYFDEVVMGRWLIDRPGADRERA
jgi:RimJ/RimL family protein N-acetyltransferase